MRVRVCVIGGTGSYHLDMSRLGEVIDEITLDTPFGRSMPITLLRVGGEDIALIHRHGRKRFEVAASFVNYRANIYAAKELGAERIISWNAVGSINPLLSVSYTHLTLPTTERV